MLQPLLDRIEIIHVPAYLPIEKIQIAEQYLIPQFNNEYGFERKTTHDDIMITKAALVKIINEYCGHEAGVRKLRKCIDRIYRKVVALIEAKKTEETATSTVLSQPIDNNIIQETKVPVIELGLE